jgi:signal transduction histidine kinase
MKSASSRLSRKSKPGSIGKVGRRAERPGRRESAATAATSFAHYIRTPLATTLMYLRLIQSEIGPNIDSELRDGLDAARDEIARLDRLMGHLVDYHRLRKLVVVPARVDASAVTSKAVHRMLRAMGGGEGQVEVHAGAFTDWWDAAALEQIAQNLTLNAIQHGGRPISVTVDRVDGQLSLRVRDGGRISARVAGRIFRRRPGIPKVRAAGLGLGLWLTRELAEAHRGTVTVESSPESGTTFVATLAPLPAPNATGR